MAQIIIQHHNFHFPYPQMEPTLSQSLSGIRSSLACVQCRRQHLKCDASAPQCSRCKSSGEQCQYVKSRRGGKRIRKPTEPENQSNEAPDIPQVVQSSTKASSAASSGEIRFPMQVAPTASIAETPHFRIETSNLRRSPPMPSPPISLQSNSRSHPRASEYVRAYYDSFHEAHPYILPERYLLDRLERNDGKDLHNLILVMRYIGSFYSARSTILESQNAVSSALLENDPPRNGFTVQALLLFSLGLLFRCERDQARGVLDIALDLALSHGMNRNSFAIINGESSPVLEESWRRTWWGLYIADASLAANHNATSFKLWTIPTDVSLPCEDIAYSAGQIPTPQSLAEFNEREFADEEVVYSSFAYMIDIYRIVGDVMAVFEDSNNASRADMGAIFDDKNVTNQKVAIADTKLANWDVQLPQSKRQPIRQDGEVDSLTLSAHLMRNWLVLSLHRPRSLLHTRPEEVGKVCLAVRNLPPTQCTAVEMHTLKCMRAADNIASLVTTPSIFVKQTPYATCALVSAVVAHVAACSDALSPEQISPVKDRIRLCLGMARTLGEVWPFAEARFQEAKAAARGVFGPSTRNSSASNSEMNHSPQSTHSQPVPNASASFEHAMWTNNDMFVPFDNNMSVADIGNTLSHVTAWDGHDFLNRNWFMGDGLG